MAKDSDTALWRRGFKANGSLHVEGVQLTGESGEPVVLKGMSTFGMQWQPQFASRGSVETIKKHGANLLRVAMYTGEGGYITNKEKIEKATYEAVDTALALDLYVIIDWHILRDNNPQQYKASAAAFFDRTAERYAGNGAVMYEICNEPNGDDVTWEKEIKPYAEEIIPIIRAHSPGAVILVGTPAWSRNVDEAADHPLDFDNIMYVCHFYAGSHGQWLRDKVEYALSKGAPVFVSEWGVSEADGNGGVYKKEAEIWLDYLDKHLISWANWSLGNRNETSAALKPSALPDGNWSEEDISESGKIVFGKFKR
jgi:aryl-phospho-beta-D-glucosidase BglC (GH1 family)